MSTRDLFETIKVRGWRRNGGASINAGGFRHYIVKKLYKEADRGAVFGQKLYGYLRGDKHGSRNARDRSARWGLAVFFVTDASPSRG
jgi:hypothetical protein